MELTQDFETTIMINTHDMNSVMGISDKVFFFNQGHIHRKGTKNDILTSKKQLLSDFIFTSDFSNSLRETALKK